MSPACVNDDLHFFEVELQGQITAEDPALAGQGELHLVLHHGYVGQGQLRHPLGPIEQWELGAERQLRDTVLVSTDDGAEGLVLYGWLDLDDDGVLCAWGSGAEEPAGAVVLSDYPAHVIDFELVLLTPCAGAESLFP